MTHYAASQYNRTTWAQFNQARLTPATIPVKNSVVEAAKRTIDPILAAWREANPTAQTPHWYAEIEAYCKDYPDRAWTICSLFVQMADEAKEVRTHYLLLMVYKAVKITECHHDRGVMNGGTRAVDGEYDDNQIFVCPDCGYKGA